MIQIKTEKLVEKGIKKRRVISFSGVLSEDNLPVKYLCNNPRIYNKRDQTIYISNVNNISVGNIIDEDFFQNSIAEIRKAGKALATINMEIKELKKIWHGEETFTI